MDDACNCKGLYTEGTSQFYSCAKRYLAVMYTKNQAILVILMYMSTIIAIFLTSCQYVYCLSVPKVVYLSIHYYSHQ